MMNFMQALIFCVPQFQDLSRSSLPWRSADSNQQFLFFTRTLTESLQARRSWSGRIPLCLMD